MNKQIILCAGILGGAMFSSSAQTSSASVVYTYVTDQSSYTVAPGAKVTAYVYLREALTGGSTSIITQDGGLLGAGFSASEVSGNDNGPTILSGIAGSVRSNGENFFGGFFSQAKNHTYNMSGSEIASESASVGPVPNAYDPADGQTDLIELGSLTLTGGTSVGTTTFELANENYPLVAGDVPGPGLLTATFYGKPSYTGLDANSTSPAYLGTDSNLQTFSVTVTPEPGSLAVFGIAAVGLLARRKRSAR